MFSKNVTSSVVLGFVAAFTAAGVMAYGGGGSHAKQCTEPTFHNEVPAKDAVLKSLSEISIIASSDTDMSTLQLEVDTQKIKPEMVLQASGDWLVRAKLPEPLTRPGKVRIALTANSNDDCAGFYPYFVEIRP